MTQALQPVQCLMFSVFALMNSISAPTSLRTHQSLFDHGIVAAVERTVRNTKNLHVWFLLFNFP